MTEHQSGIETLTQLPVDRLVEAVKLAGQPHTSQDVNAVTWLCDWWNSDAPCADTLRCAGVPLLWVTPDGGKTWRPAHPDHGPAEPVGLFLQPAWRTSVAACGDRLLVLFLKASASATLDDQGFLHSYLVNGTEYESVGIDYLDYEAEALQALRLFRSRFSDVYESMYSGARVA